MLPLHQTTNYSSGTVGSLVIKTSDSRPESLGSLTVSPNTLRVHTEYVLVKSVGSKSCVLNHECRELENISLPFSGGNCGGGDDSGVAIYRPFRNFPELNRTVTCMVQRPTTGVLLALATMNFVSLDLTTSGRWQYKQ
ncbi:hypothetical protein TNCV_3087001 [Trichonephila clavipes]|nr:hypothetical protein TNCV_3087001 [Trichonephila clavipes]